MNSDVHLRSQKTTELLLLCWHDNGTCSIYEFRYNNDCGTLYIIEHNNIVHLNGRFERLTFCPEAVT